PPARIRPPASGVAPVARPGRYSWRYRVRVGYESVLAPASGFRKDLNTAHILKHALIRPEAMRAARATRPRLPHGVVTATVTSPFWHLHPVSGRTSIPHIS